jgi:hypothetical protein
MTPALLIDLVVALVGAVPGIVKSVQAIQESATMSADEKAKAIEALKAQLLDDDARVQAVTTHPTTGGVG